MDTVLGPVTTSLATALPGEAVSRLLVLAAPGTTVQYCPSGEGSCTDVGDDGVGRVPLDGSTQDDAYRVLDETGDLVEDAPAPDGERFEGEGEGRAPGRRPATRSPCRSTRSTGRPSAARPRTSWRRR
jgi:hypothetical protein